MIRANYLRPTCGECGRTFDLTDDTDADEWAHGHDCEVMEGEAAESFHTWLLRTIAEDNPANGGSGLLWGTEGEAASVANVPGNPIGKATQ